MDQYYQADYTQQQQDELMCQCTSDAPCQQGQDGGAGGAEIAGGAEDLYCECSPDAACQQPPELSCACSKNAMCKKSPQEKQLHELTDIGLLRPEIEEVDLDPLIEEPYTNVDLTNSQALMVDVPGEDEVAGFDVNADNVVVYDPDDLFMHVAPQSHNLVVQRQRLLDSYIEDLSISEVEEASVALRLLINLFRQRRMDMNKMVPLFSIGSIGKYQGGAGCGCE